MFVRPVVQHEGAGFGGLMMDTAYDIMKQGQVGNGSEGLKSSVNSLAQQVANQQSELKKPQQLDVKIKIDSPLPAKVTGVSSSSGITSKVNTGEMMP